MHRCNLYHPPPGTAVRITFVNFVAACRDAPNVTTGAGNYLGFH